MLSILKSDLQANHAVSGPESSVLAVVPTMRFVTVLWFRVAHSLGARWPVLASMLKQMMNLATGADIAWQASIGPGLVVFHPTGVVIGPYVVLGAHCRIQAVVTIGGGKMRAGGRGDSPTVGDDCEIGAGARLIGAISIGDRVTVGANAVVLTDIPADHIAVGVPARARART